MNTTTSNELLQGTKKSQEASILEAQTDIFLVMFFERRFSSIERSKINGVNSNMQQKSLFRRDS